MMRFYYILTVLCQVAAVMALGGFWLSNIQYRLNVSDEWQAILPFSPYVYIGAFAVAMFLGLYFLRCYSYYSHRSRIAEREDEQRRINDQIELSN